MNILLISLGVLAGIFILFMAYAWILTLIPSPKFDPVGYTPKRPAYWPTGEFQTTTPEEQGMDSKKLVQIANFHNKAHTRNPDVSIDSISINRNGFNVANFVFNPLYSKDQLHVIHSVTKSIMSALIGIAIEKGFIESVEVPFVSFFPEKQSAIKDDRMRTVRIKDLLSMQTGIRSRDYAIYRWEGLFEMQKSDDWVSYIMGLPLDADPGTRFDYSNMSSFLFSAILTESTGMDSLSFARKHLFTPLGIQDVKWEKSPQGYFIGYARMWMKPDDMAKIGLLYLQKGFWDGKQIIPESWVTESVTPHAFPKNLVDVMDADGNKDKQLTTTQWRGANFVRPFCDGYGYQWWLDKDGSYSAMGVSGQYIMVVPQENLVVVITNASSRLGVYFPRKILDRFILPAIKAVSPLPENSSALEALRHFEIPPAPDMIEIKEMDSHTVSKTISGQQYSLEENRWNYDNFSLIFEDDKQEAQFSFSERGDEIISIAVGLDGSYLFTDTSSGRYAARGTWTAENVFELNYQQIGYSAPVKLTFSFMGNTIQVLEESLTGESQLPGKSKMKHIEVKKARCSNIKTEIFGDHGG